MQTIGILMQYRQRIMKKYSEYIFNMS